MTELKCENCGIEKQEGIALVFLYGDFYCGKCLLKMIDKIKQQHKKWVQENG